MQVQSTIESEGDRCKGDNGMKCSYCNRLIHKLENGRWVHSDGSKPQHKVEPNINIDSEDLLLIKPLAFEVVYEQELGDEE